MWKIHFLNVSWVPITKKQSVWYKWRFGDRCGVSVAPASTLCAPRPTGFLSLSCASLMVKWDKNTNSQRLSKTCKAPSSAVAVSLPFLGDTRRLTDILAMWACRCWSRLARLCLVLMIWILFWPAVATTKFYSECPGYYLSQGRLLQTTRPQKVNAWHPGSRTSSYWETIQECLTRRQDGKFISQFWKPLLSFLF